ncbi:unnamed protein product [Somion occarium]|uniref:Origin recognition complex subunit 3 n=1 Tax=Somion occarium TaxID=3059160 RepID=A0ABP1DSU3_9APHY
MTSLQDLHDPTKTCISLVARDHSDLQQDNAEYPDYTPFSSRDIPGGYDLRLKAYREAWKTCCDRIQSIVRALNAPLVSTVVSHIRNAYSKDSSLPNLPYPELPVVALSAPGGHATILSDVIDILHESGQDRAGGTSKGKERAQDATLIDSMNNSRAIVTHLHPSECPNLLGLMKALVCGFVEEQDASGQNGDEGITAPAATKRKATASLANYDIRLLVAWYTALLELRDPGPQLVVVLHDFERFNVAALQDMFYICSQHISRLPLVFLLELSSPANPSYLHTAFSRSTLALLRISTVAAPSGVEVVREIVQKTFFDVGFEPDVMLGPATLDFLIDYSTRHSASVDGVLNIIQLAFLKHFDEPFSLFVHDTYLGTRSKKDACGKLQRPESFNFLDSLLTRIWHDCENLPGGILKPEIDWRNPSVSDVLDLVFSAHTESKQRAQRMKLGFQVMLLVQDFMRSEGYKSTSSGKDEDRLEFLTGVVRGRVSKDVRYLGMAVKKLTAKELDNLISILYQFFQSLKPHLRRDEEPARVRIVAANMQLPREALDEEEPDEQTEFPKIHPAVPPIAADIGEWLVEYLESRIVRLDQGLLWDVWNTGMTPFPSELLNPAPGQSIVNALLHPYDFVESQQVLTSSGGLASDEEINGESKKPQRRLINVFDWYESFSLALEMQRRHLRKQTRRTQRKRTASASPRKGKGKARKPAADTEDEEEDFDSKEEEEKWKVEVQARFIRALHELDFMGFIKHTNRKADHVIKTTYDIPD